MSTKGRLIEAMRALLWERGYEATSPKAILERSSAGQGSLYHHFSGKAELAVAALEEVEIEMRTRIDGVLCSEGPPLERIEEYLRLPREALKGCPLGRLAPEPATTERDEIRDPLRAYFSHVQHGLATVLREAQREGDLDAYVNIEALAATLFAVVQGGYVIARGSGDPEQMEKATRGAMTLLGAARSKNERGK